MLLLIQKIPAYSGFLKQVRSQRGKLLALEEESMGFNHTAVTGELLKRWMLPEMIVDAVTVHGDDTSVGVPALAGDGTKSEKGKPPKGGTPTDRKITQSAAACTTRPRTKPGSANKVRESVELAELISRLLVDEDCRSLEELERTGQRDHRFSTDRLQALVAVIEEKVRQLADVLALRLDDGQDYCDVLARAHAQLSEAAAEAVTQILDGRESERFTQVDNELLAGQVQSLAAEMTRLSPGWWKSPPPPRRACEEIGTGSTAPCVEPRESRQREAPVPIFSQARREEASGKPLAPPTPQDAIALAGSADPALLAALVAAVSDCRQSRCALSLLRLQSSCRNTPVPPQDERRSSQVRSVLEFACQGLDPRPVICDDEGGAGFAVILSGCERETAIHLGNELIEQICRPAIRPKPCGRAGASVGVGVATVSLPPRNFPPQDLIAAADRCLYASNACGGGVVKSIEIY